WRWGRGTEEELHATACTPTREVGLVSPRTPVELAGETVVEGEDDRISNEGNGVGVSDEGNDGGVSYKEEETECSGGGAARGGDRCGGGLALVEVDAAATKKGAGGVSEQEAQSNDGGGAAMVAGVGIFSLTGWFSSSLLAILCSLSFSSG
ncbi:hypothetical protein PIB30_068763, partial [Stylosanthes scabra]|nr:hypothetical protein [Stylosanthes scabra]